MSKKIKLKRLSYLKELGIKLRELPLRNFDMSEWVSAGSLSLNDPLERKLECGFAGCAIGWFPTLVPEVAKEGFTLSKTPLIAYFYPTYKKLTSFNAIQEFLYISLDDASRLFDSSEYSTSNPTPKQVSRRILSFVSKRERQLSQEVA